MTAKPRLGARSVLRSRIRVGGIIALASLVVGIAIFLAWASSPMAPEPGPLTASRADHAITLTETADGVALAPHSPNGTGLVFLAGARVDPAAYADKLRGLADAGVTVVIARPTLNFAIFETRPLSVFEGLAPDSGVKKWYVGGHSLGGVGACQYAADAPRGSGGAGTGAVAGVILFGSYCAVDLSHSGLPVLTLSASEDGLSTPAKIADAAHLLPKDAQLVSLPGADHAQFGDYGLQPGDGTATSSDAQAKREITAAVLAFVG
ncbi:MAG: alpha/beta hydrolase [Acetobacteraceae bacterium]